MDWMKQLGGVLDRYADRGAMPPPDSAVHEDFAQRVNILTMLLTTLGPLVVQQILARRKRGTAASGQGGVLGQILRGGSSAPQRTPQTADQLDPQDVEDIAREAEKKDPSVIDRISQVYAQQPHLVKMLGGAALAIALGRMAQRRSAGAI